MSALDFLKRGRQATHAAMDSAYSQYPFRANQNRQEDLPQDTENISEPAKGNFFNNRVTNKYRFLTGKFSPAVQRPVKHFFIKSILLRYKLDRHLQKMGVSNFFSNIPSCIDSIFIRQISSLFPGLFGVNHPALLGLEGPRSGLEDPIDFKANSYYQMNVFKKVSKGVRSAGREVRRSARKTAKVVRHASRDTREWVKEHPTETAVIALAVAAVVTGGILAAAGAPAAGAATASAGMGAGGGAATKATTQPRRKEEDPEENTKTSVPPPPPASPPKPTIPSTLPTFTPTPPSAIPPSFTQPFTPSYPNSIPIPPEYKVPEIHPALKNIIPPVEPRYVPLSPIPSTSVSMPKSRERQVADVHSKLSVPPKEQTVVDQAVKLTKDLVSKESHRALETIGELQIAAGDLGNKVADILNPILPSNIALPKQNLEDIEHRTQEGHQNIDEFFDTSLSRLYTPEMKEFLKKYNFRKFTQLTAPNPYSRINPTLAGKISAQAGNTAQATSTALSILQEAKFQENALISGLTTISERGALEKIVSSIFEDVVTEKATTESMETFKKAKTFLDPYRKQSLSEIQARELIHQAGVKSFPRPQGLPEDFIVSISDRGAGLTYIHPENNHISVRVMPGKPHSPHVHQRTPYVIHREHGQTLDKFGNIVSPTSPEAHIPLDEFKFGAK